MKKFFSEFKKFISRGSVFDMAVGLIIATAFNKIVSSLVNDILMPLITFAVGKNSLAELSIPLRKSIVDGVEVVTLSWNYGNFLQTVIDFFIIALSVFIMVKAVNLSREKLLEFNQFVVTETKKETKQAKKEIRKQAKEQGKKFKDLWAIHLEEKRKQAEEQAKILAEEKAQQEEEERRKNPTEQDLLKEIRDLLKQNMVESDKNKDNKSSKVQTKD